MNVDRHYNDANLPKVNVRFGSVPACRARRWIFNLATCYADLNGRVRPEADLSKDSPNKEMMDTNAPEFERTVTLKEAYQLLEAFIIQYHARGECSTIELLADIGLGPQGYSSDPAQVQDFLNTANTLLGPSKN